VNPTVSIIICTRNRAEHLRKTLHSIAAAEVPAGWTVEVLVVDNASTDGTSEAARMPDGAISFRIVAEPRAGKSHAYNTGLRESRGDILIFTDDDVRVPTAWIAGMAGPIVAGTADAIAGGVVFPAHVAYALHRSPVRTQRAAFASSDYLDPEAPDCMIGANMAFHRRVLEKVPAFDLELGPGPDGLGNFEDILFSWRIKAAGYRLRGALTTAVEHHFELDRLSIESVLESARRFGRSHAYVFHHWEHRRSRLAVLRGLGLATRLRLAPITDRLLLRTRSAALDHRVRLEAGLAFCREYARQRHRSPNYPPRVPGA